MKKYLWIIALAVSTLTAYTQENITTPAVVVKWAPTGLIVGSVSLQGEYNFGKHSLTAKIGVPSNTHHSFTYQDKDADFSLKATSFLAGYRTYLSKKRLRGLYFEPYFKYVHHTAEGIGNGTLTNQPVVMSFTNDYNGIGVGAQLGAQFLIAKRFVVDLFFLGPEINSARDNFKAVEVSNSLPWTSVQAEEAEKDIRDFIDNFPFIRNRVDVMVDKANRTVTTDFKGALPGFRMGVSVGYAF